MSDKAKRDYDQIKSLRELRETWEYWHEVAEGRAVELAKHKAQTAALVKAVGDVAKCKNRDTVAFSWAIDRLLNVYEALTGEGAGE